MTLRIPIIQNVMFDPTVYVNRLDGELSLTNQKPQIVTVFPAPTGSDAGISGSFEVPQNYSSSPVMVARFIINGTPADTFAVGATILQVDVSETVDAAYEAEDLANISTWTGYSDEEEFSISITLTPSSALVPGRTVYYHFYRDDSVDTTTWSALLVRLMFQYTEA